jgi:uncharacterized membrane protein YdjX (TVP38/TMEM64 family)
MLSDSLLQYLQEHPASAPFLYFTAFATLTALAFPGASALNMLGGFYFGNIFGTLLAVSANTTGATIAFLATRLIGRKWVEKRWGPKLQKLNQGLASEGARYIFSLRLAPVTPFFLLNFVFGLTHIEVWKFALFSWLGMIPGVFVYANAGAELGGVKNVSDVLTLRTVGAFALLAIFP